MKNRKKLNQMNDEQLAQFICNWRYHICTCDCPKSLRCYDCVKKWLKMEGGSDEIPVSRIQY